MSSSKIKKISNVLSAVGIVLLLIALLFGFSFIKIGVQNLVAIDNVEIDIENGEDSRIKTEGKLVSMNTQVSVVSYEVDGNEYSTELQVYTDEFKPGDSIDIYYSKENPADVKSISLSMLRLFFMAQLSHPYMTTGKTIALNCMDLYWQNLCFLILCLGLS